MKRSFTHQTPARLFLALGLAVLGLLIQTQGIAQESEAIFKVLAAQGEVATNKQTEVVKLVAGKSLYRDQIIQITGKGYLGLMHKSGKPIELREPGSYKVWDLDASVSKVANASITKKYAKYVFGELQRDEDKPLRKNHQQYMAVTGAVSRAAMKAGVVKAYIPTSTYVSMLAPTTVFWSPVANADGYIITVQDMFDTVVWRKETNDTTVSINFAELKELAESRTGIIKVGTKTRGMKNAVGYPVKLMTESENIKVMAELADFKKTEVTDSKSALDDLVMGFFYESAGLNLNALEAFKSAVIKAPEIEDYRYQYTEYLFRSGLLLGRD